MASTFSPPTAGDNDNNQEQEQQRQQSQRRSANIPTTFVLGRPHTGPGRVNSSQQFTNGDGPYPQVSDAQHGLSLLDHLSTDLANLLNRTDISDCFLNVQGTMNFILRKIFIRIF
jgi:hypothetical protein